MHHKLTIILAVAAAALSSTTPCAATAPVGSFRFRSATPAVVFITDPSQGANGIEGMNSLDGIAGSGSGVFSYINASPKSIAGVSGILSFLSKTSDDSPVLSYAPFQQQFLYASDGDKIGYTFSADQVETKTFSLTDPLSVISLSVIGTVVQRGEDGQALGDPLAATLIMNFKRTHNAEQDGQAPWSMWGQFYLNEPAGAVPEPANWALLIGGFGLIGFTRRRAAKTTPLAM